MLIIACILMVVVLGFGMYYSAIVEWEHYESDCSTFTLEEIKKLTDSGKLKIEITKETK